MHSVYQQELVGYGCVLGYLFMRAFGLVLAIRIPKAAPTDIAVHLSDLSSNTNPVCYQYQVISHQVDKRGL